MATPIRRTAAPPPPAQPRVAIGDLSTYGGGFTLPEGDYALEFATGMEKQHEKMGNRQPRLGLFVYAHSLNAPKEEPFEQFLSFGTKAAASFTPTEDGKGITPVPGAGGTLPNSSNAALFIKSLYDSGLPAGIFTDDFSVLDGVWVHTQQIPEPEDRKGFASGTGEVEEEKRKPGKIPVVTEIKDDGKPWEGTGGFDFKQAEVAAPVKPSPRAAGPRAAPRAAPTRPTAVAAPAPVAAAGDEEEIALAATNALSEVLGANAAGLKKLKLRTESFKYLQKTNGEGLTQQVMSAYFGGDDANLSQLLGELGYIVKGQDVVPAE